MEKVTTHMRVAIGALLMLCAVAFAAPVSAQQRNPDGSVNPSASAVQGAAPRLLFREMSRK